MSNQALLNINQIAARKGAAELEFAVKKVNSLDKSKGGPEGYLKAIERRVEDLVFDEVQKFQKEDNLLGTQSGNVINNSNITWVLKPIDGTENFLKGYPHFSISLCSVVDNLITSAVVIDPIRREEFSAYSGSGASLNNNKIRASKQNTLKDATLSFKKSVKDKSLEKWAKQNILLLNTSLTVIQGKPNSHKNIWNDFTKFIINEINNCCQSIIFVAWGAYAHDKLKNINLEKHKIIISSHPSPLSVYKNYKIYPAFNGSKPFSKINNILENNNEKIINW